MNKCGNASIPSDYWHDLDLDEDDLKNILDTPLASQNKSQLRIGRQHTGFDNNVGDTWLYPSNLPQRSYQLNIVKASLFNNTLVVLPTGLGKTFIASVVMYNIYRWYPTSKIIFMAPTRPLVAQQIEACQSVMPFPDEDTIELTGMLARNRRKELWNRKRVFFATPQVVQSDISDADESSTNEVGLGFPFDQVKLIVVDEAHRAKGRYAYTKVIQTIKQRNDYFRVLALSATPGRTMEDIAEVVRNLFISHIEVRCETSIDVLPYVHKRHIKTVVVPLGEDLKALREEVLDIIDPYLRQLIEAKVLSGSLTKISRNYLLFEQKRFRDQSRKRLHPDQSAVSKNFSFCISMYHVLELLERHGMRVFLNYFEDDEEGRCKFVVTMEPRLRRVLDRLKNELGPNPFEFSTHPMTNGQIAKLPDNLDFGHPKFEEARKCLVEHFQAQPNSRAIVFCEYRESVMLIIRLLLQHAPLLKPRHFVGQGGKSGSLRPLTQKEQIKIMQDFRSGKNNILVATSIGEEGIDVGEVELIVCFDINTSNPQRFIQRIGRTGRQKNGNVVILVTEGREQQILKSVLEHKDQTNAKILQSIVVQESLYKYSPRLVPTELDPRVIQVFIKPLTKRNGSHESGKIVKENKLKKQNKKNNEKDCKIHKDLRTFFKQKNTPYPSEVLTEPSQYGLETQQNIEKCLSKIDDYFKAFEAPIATNTQLYTSNRTQPSQSNQSHRESILETQSFCNLQKLLQKNTSLIRPKELIDDPIVQLKSSKISNDGKRFLLHACPCIVSDALQKIKILELLALETDEMSAEERDVRHLYGIIEKLLGGTRLAVEIFVDDAEIEELVRKRSCIPSNRDESCIKYKEACDSIFEGLEERGPLCDNFEYIQEEFKKTNFYKDSYPETKEDDNIPCSCSLIYETVNLDEDGQNFSIIQSNCRWDDFAQNAPSVNKSTPLQGPLIKAFQRQFTKSEKKNSPKGCSLLKKIDNNLSKPNEVVEDDLDVIFISHTEAALNTTEDSFEGLHKKQETYFGKRTKNLSPHSYSEASGIEIFPFTNSYKSELDVSMEAFLEPFPEETRFDKISEDGVASTTKTKIDLINGNINLKLTDKTEHNEKSRHYEINPQYVQKLSNYPDNVHKQNSYISLSNVTRHNQISNCGSSWSDMKANEASETECELTDYKNVPAKTLKTFASNGVTTSISETRLISGPTSSISSSQKENENTSNVMTLPKEAEEQSDLSPPPKVKLNSTPFNSNRPITPPIRPPTQLKQYERSPNLYEAYLQNVRKRRNIPEYIRQSVSFAENQLTKISSFIESDKTSKRRSISSNDSSELDIKAYEGSETECEEFKETPIPVRLIPIVRYSQTDSSKVQKAEDDSKINEPESAETKKVKRQRRYQRKSCCSHDLIDNEAIFSCNDEVDEECNELPCSQNVNESMIVCSDELETFDEKRISKRNEVAEDDLDVIFVSETEATLNTTEESNDGVHAKQGTKKLSPNSIGYSEVSDNAHGEENASISLSNVTKRNQIFNCDSSWSDMKANELSETECERTDYKNVPAKTRKTFASSGVTTSISEITMISGPTSSISSRQKENDNTANLMTPIPKFKLNSTPLNSNRPITPPIRPPTQLKQYERSPNLYEAYLQNVRKRRNLPEYIRQSVSFAENQLTKISSFIASNKTPKRKPITSSDSSEFDMKAYEGSETECDEFKETQTSESLISIVKDPETVLSKFGKAEDDFETNCEEIAETQKVKRHRRYQRKTHRLQDFIDNEAIFSGDDETDEECNELPCSQNVKDSMIVSCDELETFDENAPTATQMHAFYLQSVKSPKPVKCNAFKIPAFREFNDRQQIFSQAAPLEPSQYVCDSFVVNEDEDELSTESMGNTMCPLERAERILKERRRARKKIRKVAKIQRRRRICQPTDSSDDGD